MDMKKHVSWLCSICAIIVLTLVMGISPVKVQASELGAEVAEKVWKEDMPRLFDGATEEKKEAPFTDKCGPNAYWSLEDGVLTISGTGPMYDYEFESINMSISDSMVPAYAKSITPWDMSQVRIIEIMEGITYIGKNAFIYFNAEAYERPEYQGGYYYRILGNQVEGIIFRGNTLKRIGDQAFVGCNEEDILLPESLLEIGSGAFSLNQALEWITLPSEIEEIPDFAFLGCNSLQSVVLMPGG